MPNHVTNEIIFRDVDRAMQVRILEKLCNDKGELDLEILVPPPLNMWWGNVSTKHQNAFKRTYLDWATANWGTKWNAYDHKPVERTADTLTLVFSTAWSPPYPWLAAVFNSFNLSFEHNSLDEGSDWSRHGKFDHRENDKFDPLRWDEIPAPKEIHKRLHVLRWGCESFDEKGEPVAMSANYLS